MKAVLTWHGAEPGFLIRIEAARFGGSPVGPVQGQGRRADIYKTNQRKIYMELPVTSSSPFISVVAEKTHRCRRAGFSMTCVHLQMDRHCSWNSARRKATRPNGLSSYFQSGRNYSMSQLMMRALSVRSPSRKRPASEGQTHCGSGRPPTQKISESKWRQCSEATSGSTPGTTDQSLAPACWFTSHRTNTSPYITKGI